MDGMVEFCGDEGRMGLESRDKNPFLLIYLSLTSPPGG